MTFFRQVTYSQILKNNRCLTPRVLSLRLKDLQDEGLVELLGAPRSRRNVHYRLTRKGRDIVPILTAFIQYGIRYHADQVFEDRRPRKLSQVYPEGRALLLGRLGEYAQGLNTKNP